MESLPALSLAEISAAGLRLRPTEAVTIVRALASQVVNGDLPGMPSAHVIRLCARVVTVEGPVAAGGRPVQRAAQLLSALLPRVRSGSDATSPIRQLVARAESDEERWKPGLRGLREFADALSPFAAHDVAIVVGDVTARWAAARSSLTPASHDGLATRVEAEEPVSVAGVWDVSAMRRARRETGLSLQEVSRKSRIPVSLLRQLEWGYLCNWPTGLYARTQLVRYARAAGLSQQAVIGAVWPMLEEELASRQVRSATAARSALPPATIQIIESSFPADEVLFEAEPSLRPRAAFEIQVPTPPEEPAMPQPEHDDVATAPAGDAEIDRAVRESVPAAEEYADGVMAESSARSFDVPRRSSMVAAAALLTLVTAGALWSGRSPVREPAAPAQMVRRVPARAPAAPAPRVEPAVGTSEPRTRPLVRTATTTSGPRRSESVATRTAAWEEEDDLGVVPASAGGPVFADTISSALDSSSSGLGLRIARVVEPASSSFNTRPSPDGSRIAFDSDRDGDRAVFVANADGRGVRRVSGEGFAAAPNWSRDGESLSYARAEPSDPAVWNLWMVRLSSGESRRLTANTSGRPNGASWFPDGRHIAYSRGNALVIQDIDAGPPEVVPSPVSGRAVRSPAVSPNGRWVIFQVAGDGAWLLDTSDGSTRKVLSDPAVEDYTWSPDGSRVAYYSRRDNEWSVWVMAAR